MSQRDFFSRNLTLSTEFDLYLLDHSEVGEQKAGYKTVRWDAGSLSSGIYFYKLKVIGDRLKVEKTRKMVLLR